MEPKHKWGLFVALGFAVMIAGSFLAIIPFIGLPLMGVGMLMCLIGFIVIMIIVINERKKDFDDMDQNISKEDLRP